MNSHMEEAGNTNSTDSASGGTEAPAKKAKIIMTEQQQAFVKSFKPAASKIEWLGAWLCIQDARFLFARA